MKSMSYMQKSFVMIKNNKKVRDHCHYTGKFRGAAHSICNLRYKVPKKISVVFHNGSTVPIKKEHDNVKTSTYKLKFIDSYRLMQSKLSDLVDNLSGIYLKEWKSCMERKNIKSECDFIGFKKNRLNYRCKECGKRCSKLINEAIKNFPITYQFCKGDLNKFVLLLRKSVYPYEYMNIWEKFDETLIPPKEAYYSKLNEESISDAYYVHVQKWFQMFRRFIRI